MLYIAENLKSYRKGKDLTQEEVAEKLGVSAHSVSKWERGETMPDITLLPAISNLFNVSVDVLIGMDKINDKQTKNKIFLEGHDYIRKSNINAAIEVYSNALKIFPDDEEIMSDLAMSLALSDDQAVLPEALKFCERVLADNQGEKVHHTTRAALCFIYLKAGEKEKAITVARKLPHLRESREMILAYLEKDLSVDEINSYLKFIAIGESDQQDVIEIDFGIDMVTICTEHDLLGQIGVLRDEIGATSSKDGQRILPKIRVRDKEELAPKQIRLRYYADYHIDKEYDDPVTAVSDIIKSLRGLAKTNTNDIAKP